MHPGQLKRGPQWALAVALGWSGLAFTASPAAAPMPNPGQQPDTTRIFAGFRERASAYISLQKDLEKKVPALPKEATPEQIATHQADLAARIKTSRAGARPGDLFGTELKTYVKRRFKIVFAGPEGAKLRATILEEYPGPTPVAINGRYPDRVPLTNMPVPILQLLPALPKELEYRFVGQRLIILDSGAKLVVDFIAGAMPGA